MLNGQTETIETLQRDLDQMKSHLRRMGLAPAEVQTRRVLSDAERRELIASEAASETKWRAESARIQDRMTAAQSDYEAARAMANSATDELTSLRAELVRVTEAHVELRDRVRKELL